MNTVKDHYQNHLGHFYSWMLGDFDTRRQEQENFFKDHGIVPGTTKLAIDLGSGNGIQSVALARLGFSVRAVDFSKILCDEHRRRKGNLDIEIIEEDILHFNDQASHQVDLVVCMGDTLTHLPDEKSVQTLVKEIASVLTANGKLILSFRDLTAELSGTQRFIPVRSDENRIHTCFLEYFPYRVMVTDILHDRTEGQWKLKVSSYPKLKLSMEIIKSLLIESGFTLDAVETIRGQEFLVAQLVK
jgi:SAM-dependent methyltransferase